MTIKTSNGILIIFLIVLISWWLIELTFGFFYGIDGLSFKLHKSCVEFVENKGTYDFLNLKILCSYTTKTASVEIDFLEQELYSTFMYLGLIHLLVASGSHLLIINQGAQFLIRFFTSRKYINYLVLFLFVLISNFCAPVTRCFFQIIIGDISRQRSTNWSRINLTVISSIIYLLFFPSSVVSLSFWLSLSASLCLALFSANPIVLSISLHIVLYPFIYNFFAPSVVAIFVNTIITPFLGPLLIWNSVLYVFVSEYRILGDQLLSSMIHLLNNFIIDLESSNSIFINITKQVKILYGFAIMATCLLLQDFKSKNTKKLIYELEKF